MTRNSAVRKSTIPLQSETSGNESSRDLISRAQNGDVDAFELMIIPVTLGTGKRLFQDGTIPAAFKVTSSQVAPKGIISVTYERDGDVRSGAPQIEEDE